MVGQMNWPRDSF